MTAIWIEPEPVDAPAELYRAVGGHPLVAELLVRRGISTPEQAAAFLDVRRYRPASPFALPDVDVAVSRLVRALQNQEAVVVWGDFDVDGQTATAILHSTLSQLGFRVDFYVPHRLDESHGLNRPALDELLAKGMDLLLTCDCGVSDVADLEYCRQRGLDVIVTDHHDLPEGEAPALAVVNPKRLPPDHALYDLSGAGVAYKLAEALFTHYNRPALAKERLDLAALGTIADIVPLLRENRYLVQAGLPLMAKGRRAGLRALAQVAGIDLEGVDTETIGFTLAPILNSSGRLASADVAVRLLMTTDARQAEKWALEVARLNEERRYETELAESLALDMLRDLPSPLPPVLVLASAEWHPGVTGIVAGRLAQMFHRPAVMISLGANGMARGSARSVAGFDLHQAILQQRDLLLAEGGHPMAAGFALSAADVEELRRRLIQTVGRMMEGQPLRRTLSIDAWIEWSDVTLGLCEELGRLAPFGEGNRPPVLASRRLSLTALQTMGEKNDHFRLRLADREGIANEVIWWNGDRELIPRGLMDAAYTLRANLYGGARRLQIELVDLRPSPPAPLEIAPAARSLEVVDHRGQADLVAELEEWLDRATNGESVQCWGEGPAARERNGLRRRDQIRPADTLVIWTTPAGPNELRQALEASQARRVVLLCGDRPEIDLKNFLTELVGLIKHAIAHKGGEARLDALAGALAQRRGAVLAGLELLRDVGITAYDLVGQDNLFFLRYRPEPVKLKDILAQPAAIVLRQILDETAAYRRWAATAPVDDLVPKDFTPRQP